MRRTCVSIKGANTQFTRTSGDAWIAQTKLGYGPAHRPNGSSAAAIGDPRQGGTKAGQGGTRRDRRGRAGRRAQNASSLKTWPGLRHTWPIIRDACRKEHRPMKFEFLDFGVSPLIANTAERSDAKRTKHVTWKVESLVPWWTLITRVDRALVWCLPSRQRCVS